jgi:endonuclease/exonuclease/phosphatase family metal-dependent hydrolase
LSITLATYNIHACVGMDGRFDVDRVIRVLKEMDPDLIALQEVEHHDIDGLDLLEYLAAQTGMQPIAGPTLLREERGYGNALLTRLPVTKVFPVDLSLPGREPRGAIEAILDWQGLSLQIVATHLGLLPGERRHQTRRLLALLEAGQSDVAVLLGDLNEWLLWGRPLRWLHRQFTPVPALRTFPARFPVFALDRIWVHPHTCMQYLETHDTVTARIASDHLPLKAVLDLALLIRTPDQALCE